MLERKRLKRQQARQGRISSLETLERYLSKLTVWIYINDLNFPSPAGPRSTLKNAAWQAHAENVRTLTRVAWHDWDVEQSEKRRRSVNNVVEPLSLCQSYQTLARIIPPPLFTKDGAATVLVLSSFWWALVPGGLYETAFKLLPMEVPEI